MAVLARFDLPIPEQVIEVPKTSCSLRFSHTVLRSPQLAEQLVDVPVPSFHQCTRMADFRDDGGRRWCLLTGPEPRRFSRWLVGTDHEQGTPAGDHRQPRAVYKYWARLRISLRPLVPGSYLFGVGLPEECLCGFFPGDDFWIYFRVQRFLVRQWMHVSSSLRRLLYLDPAIDSRPALLSCVCREEYKNWIWCRARVDNGSASWPVWSRWTVMRFFGSGMYKAGIAGVTVVASPLCATTGAVLSMMWRSSSTVGDVAVLPQRQVPTVGLDSWDEG